MSEYTELLRLTAPQIVVALTALAILVLDLSWLRRAALALRFRWAAAVGCGGCAIALVVLERASAQGTVSAGMLVANPLTQLMQAALLVLAILVLLLVDEARFTPHVGEYAALVLFATTAMMLLVGTQNLLVIFISIEFLSLSLYILTAFDKRSRQSAEAGLKYFLFGGMSAGLLLFGVSLLYGLSGSLALGQIAAAIHTAPGDPMLAVATVLIFAGFGFKVAAAPFHMWAPEVYQGAPTASAALVASSSKVASFFALFVLFAVGMTSAAGSAAWHEYQVGWAPLVAIVAVVSMLWGNLAALAQSSVRRLMAYSAIGHAGYMLITLAMHTRQSLIALVYYVITYALASLGAFGVLFALEEENIDSLADFRGLGKRSPDLAFCLLIFLLSLAGIPPLAGFFGKFYVFVSALHGLLWLVLLALATSVVSFYYYLKILKQVYVIEPANNTVFRTAWTTRFALWAMASLVLVLGCLPDLLLNRIAVGMGAWLR